LNHKDARGALPCQLSISHDGSHILVANYNGKNVIVFPIRHGGSLGDESAVQFHEGRGVHPTRQEHPHPHSINLDASGQFAFVTDLGIDEVVAYAFDGTKGTLQRRGSVSIAPGSGPRQLTWHPSNKFAYVINELNSTITVLSYDGHGGLIELQTIESVPPAYQQPKWSAEIKVHPSGNFLYASNRISDVISVFSVDVEGKLALIAHYPSYGKTPRNFLIDPRGDFLIVANQHSDNIVVFKVDSSNGHLQLLTSSASVPSPVCLTYL